MALASGSTTTVRVGMDVVRVDVIEETRTVYFCFPSENSSDEEEDDGNSDHGGGSDSFEGNQGVGCGDEDEGDGGRDDDHNCDLFLLDDVNDNVKENECAGWWCR